MKLQISFDIPDLEESISKAKQVTEFCDIIEIGNVLICKYGIHALQEFKKTFPQKTILADLKILDRGKMITSVVSTTNIDWITVMAGTSKNVIHAVCTTAKEKGIKVMLDLLDAQSLGQSALEAKNLGVDALIFHRPHDEKDELLFLEDWDIISGNTDLPIFISAKIKRENIDHIINIKPAGIVVGTSIITAENPKIESKFFYELTKK